MKIRSQDETIFLDLDKKEVQMIIDNIIKGDGTISINSVTLNYTSNYDFEGHIEYPLQYPVIISKKKIKKKDELV